MHDVAKTVKCNRHGDLWDYHRPRRIYYHYIARCAAVLTSGRAEVRSIIGVEVYVIASSRAA